MSKPIAKLVHLHSIIIDVTDGTGHHGISYKSEYRQHIVNTIFSKRGKSYTNSKINHFWFQSLPTYVEESKQVLNNCWFYTWKDSQILPLFENSTYAVPSAMGVLLLLQPYMDQAHLNIYSKGSKGEGY